MTLDAVVKVDAFTAMGSGRPLVLSGQGLWTGGCLSASQSDSTGVSFQTHEQAMATTRRSTHHRTSARPCQAAPHSRLSSSNLVLARPWWSSTAPVHKMTVRIRSSRYGYVNMQTGARVSC